MRIHWAPVALFAVVAALAVGITVWVRQGDSDGELPILRGEVLATSAILRPQAHLFGERVTARLEVVFDERRVRPESVAAAPRFAPYRPVRRRTTRESVGHVVRVRNEYVLECVTSRCLPPKGGVFQFPVARVEYAPRARPDKLIASVEWPSLRVASRISAEDLDALDLQADVRDLPPLSYEAKPGTLAVVGYPLAVLLALVSLALLARALELTALARRALAQRRARRSPLQRALAVVRRAMKSGERNGSRRALERLAAELHHTEESELARKASRIAWRRAEPSATSVEPLSDEVERVIAEEAR